MSAHGGLTMILALAMVGLGVALLVVTLAHGGGTVGIALGILFMAAGVGRLYVLRRKL